MTQNERDMEKILALFARKEFRSTDLDTSDRDRWLFRWLHIPVYPALKDITADFLGVAGDEVPKAFKTVAFSPFGIDEPWAYMHGEKTESPVPGLIESFAFRVLPVSCMAHTLETAVGGTFTADLMVKEKSEDPKVRAALLRPVKWRCGDIHCHRFHFGRCMAIRVGVPDGEVIGTVVEASMVGAVVHNVSLAKLVPINLEA